MADWTEWLGRVGPRVAEAVAARLASQDGTAFHTFGAATTRHLVDALLQAMRNDLAAGNVADLRQAASGLCQARDDVSVPLYDLRLFVSLLRDALLQQSDGALDRGAERAMDGWLQQLAFQIGLQFIVQREEVIEQQASELEVQIAELQASHAEASRLLDLVHRVSIPILPVHAGVLVVPLIGTIDAERAQRLIETVLEAVTRTRSRFVIFDITGVPVFDEVASDSLMRVAGATRLLGAELVLVGVAPEVARVVIESGVQLGGLSTRASLQEGLAYVLARSDGAARRGSAPASAAR